MHDLEAGVGLVAEPDRQPQAAQAVGADALAARVVALQAGLEFGIERDRLARMQARERTKYCSPTFEMVSTRVRAAPDNSWTAEITEMSSMV